MSASQFRPLRVVVVVLLVVLVVQFEFGMAVNLSSLPSLAPLGFSLANVFGALSQAGLVAVIHAGVGTALTFLSLVSLVMSIASRMRSVQVFGVLSFLSTFLAEVNGVLFVLSGFQNDGYSHGMATSFILTFTFCFLELYFLKSAAKT